MYDAVEAIRARGYIQDLPEWLTTDESILSSEELNSTLSLLYYFINQMERVQESENKLQLSPKEHEEVVEVSGFGFDDIDLQARFDRLNADREHLLRNQAMMMEQIQKSRHETAVLAQRLASADSAHKEATKGIVSEREFLRRQVADFKQRETQHQHETRRLEMDNENLRDRLRNALSGGAKISKPATSSLPEGFSKPAPKASSATSAKDATKESSSGSRVVDSNALAALKSHAEEVEREMFLLLTTLSDQMDDMMGLEKRNSKKETDLSSLYALVKQKMAQLPTLTPRNNNSEDFSEIEALREQLATRQQLIEEQHKLLTLAVSAQPNEHFQAPSDAN